MRPATRHGSTSGYRVGHHRARATYAGPRPDAALRRRPRADRLQPRQDVDAAARDAARAAANARTATAARVDGAAAARAALDEVKSPAGRSRRHRHRRLPRRRNLSPPRHLHRGARRSRRASPSSQPHHQPPFRRAGRCLPRHDMTRQACVRERASVTVFVPVITTALLVVRRACDRRRPHARSSPRSRERGGVRRPGRHPSRRRRRRPGQRLGIRLDPVGSPNAVRETTSPARATKARHRPRHTVLVEVTIHPPLYLLGLAGITTPPSSPPAAPPTFVLISEEGS